MAAPYAVGFVWCAVVTVGSWSPPELVQSSMGESSARRVVTAAKTSSAIEVDGQLNEPEWRLAEPATGFIQQEPAEGQSATRQTDVRFVYDDSTLYIGARLYDDDPARAISDELKRDFDERSGDLFGIVLDTFLDGRNSYGFLTNPDGAQREVQAFDNGQKYDASWNGAWAVRTVRQVDGWTVEAGIPFKTLRFPDRLEQRWGLNLVRIVRRVNEVAMWSPVPRPSSHYHVGYAGVLTGLEGLRPSQNLRLTPFVITEAARPGSAAPWRATGDSGFDLKWSVTPSFVLDATYHTDFAQVEADEQQINLTRFSLLFPEKRQFFLEAPNSFQIGLASQETGVVATSLIPFFTRRIGLSERGAPVPVTGGLRLTGQSGGTTVGLLNMQTGSRGGISGDNFTAVRLAQPVGGGLVVGGAYFGRQANGAGAAPAGAYNRVVAADARFSPARIVDVEGLLMRGFSDGPEDDSAGRVRARLRGNKTRATFDYLHIGDNFRHDLGFVRRRGISMLYGDYSQVFRPRATQRWAREHILRAEVQTHLNTGYDHVLTNQDRASYTAGLAGGGDVRLMLEHNFEWARESYRLRGVLIPAGKYEFDELVLMYLVKPHSARLRTGADELRGVLGRVTSAGEVQHAAARQHPLCRSSALRTGADRPAQWRLRCGSGRSAPRLVSIDADVPSLAGPVRWRQQDVALQSSVQYHPPPAERHLHRLERGRLRGHRPQGVHCEGPPTVWPFEAQLTQRSPGRVDHRYA